MTDKRTYFPATAFCVLILMSAVATWAQDAGDIDEGGERCIDTRQIRTTRIIDNRNVLFYMRDRTIYHNELPHACSGLRRGKAISYRTSLSKLCSIDTITVLDNYGAGMTQGPSCGLGKFRPITEEEADALRDGPDADIEPEPIEPAEPEEPELPE
jgi:hypothetical protein